MPPRRTIERKDWKFPANVPWRIRKSATRQRIVELAFAFFPASATKKANGESCLVISKTSTSNEHVQRISGDGNGETGYVVASMTHQRHCNTMSWRAKGTSENACLLLYKWSCVSEARYCDLARLVQV